MSEVASERSGNGWLQPFLAELSKVDEGVRYQLVGKLFAELASQSRDGSNGRGPSADEFEAMQRKNRALREQIADAKDAYELSQSNLTRLETQLQAEQTQVQDLSDLIDGQRPRMESAQSRVAELEAALTSKSAETHRLETHVDDLELKLQRAELVTTDTSKVDVLEESRLERSVRVQVLEARIEELRQTKDAEIEALKAQLADAQSGGAAAADTLLTSLWERLARTQPPLVPGGGGTPTPQAAERMTDAVIELATALHELDQDLRPFFDKYTRRHPAIDRPWKAYVSQDEFRVLVGQVLAPIKGRPPGIMRIKLGLLRRWTQAAVFATDATLAWAASQLEELMLSDAFAGSDPNLTLKAFLRMDGHELFMEQLRKLYSEKLAELFGGQSG